MIKLAMEWSDARRYRASFAAVLMAGLVAFWPVVLDPLARFYTRICATIFADSAAFHHFPPYLIAVMFSAMVGTILIAAALLIRHLVGLRWMECTVLADHAPVGYPWMDKLATTGVADRIMITRTTDVYAFCTGFLRPRVYVSEGLLNALTLSEIEAVLRHEAQHCRRRDPLCLFLADVLQHLTAPFPALKTQFNRMRVRIELTADQAALEVVPVDVLASAIVKVACARPLFRPQVTVAGLTPNEARIAALLGRPVATPFDLRDLVVTAAVLLSMSVVVTYLAGLPFPMMSLCDACSQS